MKGCFFVRPFLEKYGKQVFIPASIGVALLVYFFFLQNSTDNSSTSIETIDALNPLIATTPVSEPEQLTVETSTSPPMTVMIDVKGAVNYPGVYTLEEGQRIVDAIEMAGGYAEAANPTLINHAQKLQDEMVIYIPKLGEELTEIMPELVQTAQGNRSSSGSTNNAGKINLNKAEVNELTQLPGVGPSKATAIIQHRTEQGTFQTIEDLKKVTGIGEKTFEQLKDLIDVK